MQPQTQKRVKKMQIIPGGNQMSLIRDTEEVVKFLEFAGRKSILKEHAITNRLTACHNIFSVLNEEEDNLGYILSNLDVLINRFRNKNNNVMASTLKVYKSRVKSSIEDFQSWSSDPFEWERRVTDKAKSAAKTPRKEKVKTKGKSKKVSQTQSKGRGRPSKKISTLLGTPNLKKGSRQVSFPIRPDFSVEMNLPADGLTRSELHRLGLFLFPYCNDIDLQDVVWPKVTH